MRGVTAKTPERVALAKRLRAQGLMWREIGERLGVSPKTAQTWVADPDGAVLRARKDSYAQPCVDCGDPTSGSDGRREEPRCQPCAAVKRGAEAKIWTRDAIILAMQEWQAVYGELPAVPDWDSGTARLMGDEARARRYENALAAGQCPSFKSAVVAFGSWNAAIRAAGGEPRAAHGGAGNERRRRSMRAKNGAT